MRVGLTRARVRSEIRVIHRIGSPRKHRVRHRAVISFIRRGATRYQIIQHDLRPLTEPGKSAAGALGGFRFSTERPSQPKQELCVNLMAWMPPPDGIVMCQAGDL